MVLFSFRYSRIDRKYYLSQVLFTYIKNILKLNFFKPIVHPATPLPPPLYLPLPPPRKKQRKKIMCLKLLEI